MNKIILSSSILSADFAHLEDQINQAEISGVDWIHIDVMDGHFVPNLTMGPFIVETCRRITQLPLDVHLMVENPESLVEAFVKAGATNLTIHIENNPNVLRTLQYIRELGVQPAIAINPGTPITAIESILPHVDMVLVMTVNPGFSGQKFIPQTVDKIIALKDISDSKKYSFRIEVDGGITTENIHFCASAGANTFVAATAIFKHPQGISAGIQALRSAVK